MVTQMDLKQIKALIAFLDGTRFTEVEFEQEGVRLRLSQDTAPVVVTAAPQVVATPVALAPQAASASAPQAMEPAAGGFDVRIPEEDSGKVVASPIVGTFYSAPSPDKPAYVNVGDTVKKGQVICIVEAMKLMNEIESEFSGKVSAILVEDGEPIEFGQPLIRIEP
jgi:acetyl-CoA carboxylase biotin carboxyl carrier protein